MRVVVRQGFYCIIIITSSCSFIIHFYDEDNAVRIDTGAHGNVRRIVHNPNY